MGGGRNISFTPVFFRRDGVDKGDGVGEATGRGEATGDGLAAGVGSWAIAQMAKARKRSGNRKFTRGFKLKLKCGFRWGAGLQT